MSDFLFFESRNCWFEEVDVSSFITVHVVDIKNLLRRLNNKPQITQDIYLNTILKLINALLVMEFLQKS